MTGSTMTLSEALEILLAETSLGIEDEVAHPEAYADPGLVLPQLDALARADDLRAAVRLAEGLARLAQIDRGGGAILSITLWADEHGRTWLVEGAGADNAALTLPAAIEAALAALGETPAASRDSAPLATGDVARADGGVE